MSSATLEINDRLYAYLESVSYPEPAEPRPTHVGESMEARIADGQGDGMDLVFSGADKPKYQPRWRGDLVLRRRGGPMIAGHRLQGVASDGCERQWLEAQLPRRPRKIAPQRVGGTHAVRAFDTRDHKNERVEPPMSPAGGMTPAVKK